MKTPRCIALAAVSVTGLLCVTAAQAQDQWMKRKPGLWEVSMQMPGPNRPAMSSKQCIDDRTDAEMQKKAMGGPDQRQQCQQLSSRKIAGGVEIEMACKSDEGTTKVVSRMTGDMQSSFKVDSTMTFNPPRHGMSTGQFTMSGRHAGACPADMKPGDMRMGSMVMPGPGGQPGMAFDMEKLKNMTPEERAKFMEQMKKSMGQ